ncbi:hypothetical protein L7F22_041687 [Adiantum nelumboides]|nr:hypothetical protein [Adiantum nelumboides]
MACNRDLSADGATSPAPPPPAPATPASCPGSDGLAGCCNGNCHFSGCSPASMNPCPDCSATERLLKEGSASNACSNQMEDHGVVSATSTGLDITEEDRKDLAPASVRADMADLCRAMKFGSSTSRCKITVRQPSGSCTLQEERIPSPLSLSPPRQGEVVQPAPLCRDRAVNLCAACHKRAGLLGFKCRCGNLFCASHRYSDKHDCSYDYKAAGRLAIAKENPVVVASKICKI